MRELLFKRIDSGSAEEGFQDQYDYFILVDQMEVGGDCGGESFGVKITRSGGETATIPNITASVSRIDELMQLLTRNLVTPTSLTDVIADWL